MKPKVNYINPQQFAQIKAYVPELHIRKWLDKDVIASMDIAYYCALRYGAEVANLTKEDFDYERHEVYLGKTKTRKEDYAAVPPFFEPRLKEYWATKQPLEPVLDDCDPQNLYLWLKRIGEALGIEALTTPQKISGEKTVMHIFRKSFLKDMHAGTFGNKAPLGAIQAQARHKDLLQTVRYLRLDIEGSKEYFEDNIDHDQVQKVLEEQNRTNIF